jgi:2-polyprenyl-6-methoxyphenol hydroxylase-like FAD-dependent oxidoreductase
MFRKTQPEVLTVGAGPVGLFTGLQLHERGVKVRIIDEEMRTAAHSYALALHPGTLRLLQEAGLEAPVLSEGLRIDRVAFYDGAVRRAEMDLSELPGDFPFLCVLRQSSFERVLEDALHQRGIRVQWNHRLAGLRSIDDHVEAEVDRLEKVSSGYAVAATEWAVGKRLKMRPRFVVGADGHHSFVRRSLGIPYETVREPLFFAVFEFEVDEELPPEVRLVLTEDALNVLWPLPDRRCRWSFQLKDPQKPCEPRYKSRIAVHIAGSSYPFLTDDHLREFLEERAPWFGAKPGEITWSMIVRFETRMAASFGRGRMWLAGDSGHLTGPVGVQSMNVGMREAHDLSGRIADSLEGRSGTGRIEEYGEERVEEWSRLLGKTGGLVKGEGPDQWIHHWAQPLLSCIPASGEDLELLARQVGLQIAETELRSTAT